MVIPNYKPIPCRKDLWDEDAINQLEQLILIRMRSKNGEIYDHVINEPIIIETELIEKNISLYINHCKALDEYLKE